MKKLLAIISSVLFIIVLLLISPYNLVHYFTAKNNVTSMLADPSVRMEILEDESEITNVEYLGSNTYRVETIESVYVMEIKTDKATHIIDVFKHKQHVKKFEY